MAQLFENKAITYDKYTIKKSEIDRALVLLRDFRAKFPYVENPELIDTLKPDDIIKVHPDELGEFFHYIEVYLKPLGHLTIHGSIVYHNIRSQLEDFKDLLRVVVDPKKSLDKKVDAPWEGISRLGGDKHIAKKIIFCFNYETNEVLPIFNTEHLRYFVDTLVEKKSFPARYNTLGEEYEYLTNELLQVKTNSPTMSAWELPYFTGFLYNSYPPPERETNYIPKEGKAQNKTPSQEQLSFGEFAKLLNELQSKGKINGQQFREYRDLWMHQPSERDSLTQRLKRQLNA